MKYYRLTTPQQNIKNLIDFYPNTAIANQCGAILFPEKRDRKKLEQAVISAIARLDALRLRLASDGNGQYLSEELPEHIEVLDFASENELDAFAEKTASEPMNTFDAPLYRFYLVRVGEKTGVLTVLNHLIADAWTFGLLAHTVDLLYGGKEPTASQSYTEFIRNEEAYQASERYEKDRLFWEQRYIHAPDRTPVKLTETNHGIETKRYQTTLSNEMEASLKRACEGCKATPAVILETATLIYLMGINPENSSATIGIPVLNRTNVKEKQTAGMFISTMPLTIQADRDQTVTELAKTITSAHFGIFRHQRFPYDKITAYVRDRHGFTGNLYDVMVSYQNAVTETGARTKWYGNGYSEVPLVIHFDDRDGTGKHTVTVDYQTVTFRNEREISLLLARLEHILMQMATDPGQLVGRVSLVPESERKLLIEEFNDTYVDYPRDKCVHELFMEQVKKTPNSIALVFEELSFTYRELDEMSNSLAHFLREKGVGRNDVVPLIAKRDWRVIVAMLGILKAGGAYMPVSPDYPKERIETMIGIAGSRIAVYFGHAIELSVEKVNLADFDFAAYVNSIESINEIDDGCCAIHTSGSTGSPKLSLLTHQNIVHFVFDNAKVFDGCEVVISATIITFDAFIQETLGALCSGIRIVLLNNSQMFNLDEFEGITSKYQNAFLFMTPTKITKYLNLGSKRFLNPFRNIECGGEIFPEELFLKLRHHHVNNIFNIYGPTEATVCVTVKQMGVYFESSIGRPITNTQIYILDENLTPLPIGVAGELCIAGEGVGKGYLNQPELTAERFVPNPFTTEENHHGKVMYRTGDLTRWRADGEIEYLGRIDTQVKIRGLRIELGEIESVMSTFPGIALCAAATQKDVSGRQYLVGYYTTGQEMDVLNEKELRSHLSAKLPNYMVPNYFMMLNTMPMTLSGKTDRKNLPLPDFSASQNEHVPPETVAEKELASIWKRLLHLEQVGKTDNFFELGGDSLLAISMLGEIESHFGKRISVEKIFSHPTIVGMARLLERAEATLYIPKTDVTRFALLPQQKAIYAACMKEPESLIYNIPAKVILPPDIDREKLARCIREEVASQKILNCKIQSENNEVYAIYDEGAELEIERLEKVEDFLRPFDFTKPPLVHVGLSEVALLFDMHHIVADGTSLNILLRNVILRYGGRSPERSALWYGDYAKFYQTLDFGEHRTFWREAWKIELEPVLLPEQENDKTGGRSRFYQISRELFDRVRRFTKAHSMTDTMLCLGAYGILLAQYSGKSELMSSIVLQNRTYADIKEMVGMFANTLPVQFSVKGSLGEYFEEMKAQILELFRYQELPLHETEKAIGLENKVALNTAFVYQGDGEKILFLEGQTLTPEFVETGTHKFDLLMELTPIDDGCRMRIEYNRAKYEETLIDRIAEGYQRILSQLVECNAKDISEISVLTEEEYHKIIEVFNDTFTDYSREKCVHDLFAEQVEKMSDNTALIFEEQSFTYRGLDEMSNSLAHYLRERGMQRNEIVPLIARRDWRVIVAMLGILKAGGAYMPVSPDYPKERIETMIGIAESKIAICYGYDEQLPIERVDLAVFDFVMDIAPMENFNETEDYCCVIHTSGSTGIPKLSVLAHRNIAHFVFDNAEVFDSCESVISATIITFDAFIQETLVALCAGKRIILLNDEQMSNVAKFEDVARNYQNAFLFMTPRKISEYLNLGTNHFLDPIYSIVCGGEKFSEDLYQQLRKNVRNVFNGYGPTETTICVTTKRMEDEFDSTIGRPIANTQIYILNENQKPLPIGVVGELCIAGKGVGKGYLNQPELTAERFLPNPFATEENHHGNVLYHTGDLARWRADGEIEYLGRIDTQVKIRGLRIELGEIERVMSTFPGIALCAAMAQKDESGRQYLVGYYTLSDVSGEIDVKELRAHLSKKLPHYMVPNYFVKLDTMPMTPSGKTDRTNLPLPDFSASLNEYVPPETKTEKALCEIITELLKLERVGVNDNFFELGGDSLTAIAYIAKADEQGIHIPLQVVFAHPTVRELDIYLSAPVGEQIAELEKRRLQNSIEKLDVSKYEWYLKANVIDESLNFEKRSLGNVFLTGATGFLGAHVLDALMRMEIGKIYCLMRSTERQDRRGRLAEMLRYYFGDIYEKEIGKRIIPIVGDIETKGLSKELPSDVQTVIHTAATVKHFGSYDSFYKVNAEGTQNVADYAKSIGARMIHVSTESVSGDVVKEDFMSKASREERIFDERAYYIGQPLDNVYVCSKFEAERIILDATNEGLEAYIVRIGNQTNRSTDFKFQPNYVQNAFLEKVKAFMDLGLIPDYMIPIELEFSPIDQTAEGIVKIAQYAKNRYVFHLYNPHRISIGSIIEVLKQVDYSMRVVTGAEFSKKLFGGAHNSAQATAIQMLREDMDADGRLHYYNHIKLKNDFTLWFLQQTGFSWSEIDERYIKGYVEYFQRLGYWK